MSVPALTKTGTKGISGGDPYSLKTSLVLGGGKQIYKASRYIIYGHLQLKHAFGVWGFLIHSNF